MYKQKRKALNLKQTIKVLFTLLARFATDVEFGGGANVH